MAIARLRAAALVGEIDGERGAAAEARCASGVVWPIMSLTPTARARIDNSRRGAVDRRQQAEVERLEAKT